MVAKKRLNRNEMMQKLLQEAPGLHMEKVLTELMQNRKLTKEDREKLLDEGSALGQYARELSRYVYLLNLVAGGRWRMNSKYGTQLIENQLKWLETGIKNALERIDDLLLPRLFSP